MLDRLDRDEPVVLQDAPGMLPVDGRAGVYTALFAGRDVIGIQVAVRRQPEPFTPTEIELARRLAHTASAALAQARLLETPDASGTPSRIWRELQTPLTSILRFAERASDSTLPTTERRTLVGRIAATARDMLRMLERLERGRSTQERDEDRDGSARG
jgi:GAF domain-containing protein